VRQFVGINIKILLIIIPLFVISCEDKKAGTEWELVWQDDFNGTAGQLIDPTYWDYDIGTGWGNNQLEFDTGNTKNVSLDGNGNLVITAIQEQYEGQQYTSARIVTRDKFEQAYGKFEIRAKLPWGQGIWPAIWLLGANIDKVGWPQCGEIDIMEYRGQEPSIAHGTVHGPGYSGAQGMANSYTLSGTRFDTDFHTFSIEWETDRITWYVDDNKYHQITPDDLPGEWVFNHPFYIIINLAVGGNYVGDPNNFTQFPQTLNVDWIKVYQKG